MVLKLECYLTNMITLQISDVDEIAINEAKINFKEDKKYSFALKSIDDLDTSLKYDIINLSYVL